MGDIEADSHPNCLANVSVHHTDKPQQGQKCSARFLTSRRFLKGAERVLYSSNSLQRTLCLCVSCPLLLVGIIGQASQGEPGPKGSRGDRGFDGQAGPTGNAGPQGACDMRDVVLSKWVTI